MDKDEFRRCLKEIDPNKREPLPHNFEWAWMHGDPNNDGSITVYELKALVTMYRTYLEAQNDITDLIKRHDKNGDCKLEEHEMLGLLQDVAPDVRDLSSGDAAFVFDQIDKISSVLGKPKGKASTTEPATLSKAVASWYFKRTDPDEPWQAASAPPKLNNTPAYAQNAGEQLEPVRR